MGLRTQYTSSRHLRMNTCLLLVRCSRTKAVKSLVASCLSSWLECVFFQKLCNPQQTYQCTSRSPQQIYCSAQKTIILTHLTPSSNSVIGNSHGRSIVPTIDDVSRVQSGSTGPEKQKYHRATDYPISSIQYTRTYHFSRHNDVVASYLPASAAPLPTIPNHLCFQLHLSLFELLKFRPCVYFPGSSTTTNKMLLKQRREDIRLLRDVVYGIDLRKVMGGKSGHWVIEWLDFNVQRGLIAYPAIAPMSPIVICIAVATARFVCAETFSPGQLIVRQLHFFEDLSREHLGFTSVAVHHRCICQQQRDVYRHTVRQQSWSLEGQCNLQQGQTTGKYVWRRTYYR